MPRWLSEGISVYEEGQANPAWGEKMDLAYRDMILNGELTPISELSGAFLAPSNAVHLQFAYFESSLVVEFIVQQFGFDALKKILADLGNGEEVYQSIAKRTAPLPELEKQFAAFARARAEKLAPGVDLDKPPASLNEADAAALPGSFRTQPSPPIAGVDVKAWELAHPKNYYVQMQKAVQAMEAKNWAEAEPLLKAVADMYHGESKSDNPLWLLAVTQRHLNETNAELATLKKFAAQESDFQDLYLRLIELTVAQKDWPAVTKYAESLLAINPLISSPYRALAEAGMAAGNSGQAISAYRKLLMLDPPDPVDVHYQLARLLHSRGDPEARREVLQALEDAPRYQDALSLLLEIDARKLQPTNGPATSNPQDKP